MIEVKIFNDGKNELPLYGTENSAGFDLSADFSNLKEDEELIGENYSRSAIDNHISIHKNGRVLIPTNLFCKIPDGYELQIRPRSGLALKNGITVLNSPGTIDSDYLGNIGIILMNTSNFPFEVRQGDRIAQAVLNKVEQVTWVQVNSKEELGNTERGEGGFGSTGKK